MLDRRFIKFLVVGVLNTAFGYSLFAFFLFIGLHYVLASLLGTIIGILFNFKTTGRLVFDSSDNTLISRFFGVYTFIYIFNIIMLRLFEINGFVDMYINGLILLIPSAVVSFVLNKNFVFTESKKERE